MDFSIDASQVDKLAIDLGRAGRKATLEATKVVAKGALNIKQGMQASISPSPHFGGVAGAISYDLRGLSAEIGPEIGRGQGSLAFIAAFGASATPGFWDYAAPLEKEAPNVAKFLGEIGAKALE